MPEFPCPSSTVDVISKESFIKQKADKRNDLFRMEGLNEWESPIVGLRIDESYNFLATRHHRVGPR